MVESRSYSNIVAHAILWMGIGIVAFPVYLTLVASTHTATAIANGQMPLWFGDQFIDNYYKTLFVGTTRSTRTAVGTMMLNSLSWRWSSPSARSLSRSSRPTPSSISVSPSGCGSSG